ncbi:MAG: VOC family protein [Devosia sp.]|nr:VOC family protein [Devosia sp.]MCR6634325.1 VOC family protein [Devosia sp.]
MTKLTPCLWFDDRIDEAIKFYTTTFKDLEGDRARTQFP